MRLIFILMLLSFSLPVYAETVVFRVLDIEELEIVTDNDVYKLSEYCTVKNRYGKSLSLSELKLPCMARGNYELKGDDKILTWITITGAKNNQIVPE